MQIFYMSSKLCIHLHILFTICLQKNITLVFYILFYVPHEIHERLEVFSCHGDSLPVLILGKSTTAEAPTVLGVLLSSFTSDSQDCNT